MQPGLAIFAPLLGKCFAATLTPGLVDQHCFTAIYGGEHIRDTHVVKSGTKAVYSGETIYSVGPTGAEFTYINSDGGVGHGMISLTGSILTISGSMSGSASAPARSLNSKWTFGKDSYDVVNDGKPPLHFTRAP